MTMLFNTTELLQKLISFDTTTPKDSGIMHFIGEYLRYIGFKVQIFEFAQNDHYDGAKILNMYAKIGDGTPILTFAGHVDVVPIGAEKWTFWPFSGHKSDDDLIYGRGAVDMKGALAAFISAVSLSLEQNREMIMSNGVSMLITGDEEGISTHGTKLLLENIISNGEKLNMCIVGEPVSQEYVGDTVKIGARGSVTFDLKVYGIRGHVGYNKLADNAAAKLMKVMNLLNEIKFQHNNKNYPITNLETTHLLIEDHAENVVPGVATSQFNIRYSDDYTAKTLYDFIYKTISQNLSDKEFELKYRSSGDAFMGLELNNSFILDWKFLDKVIKSIENTTGRKPSYNTLGGTSDARFIRKYCPVLEVGLLSETAHKINENVSIKDLNRMVTIYHNIVMECMEPII